MFNFDLHILIWSLIIFAALLLQVLTGTVRVIVMVKGNKLLTSIIGFFEAAIAIIVAIAVISSAVKEGINFFTILSYALGFALGLFLGMFISNKISRDMLSINIITRSSEINIEDKLRECGFGVTRYSGSGRDGDLKVLNIICKKNNFEKLKSIVEQIDPKAMLASHTLEGLSGGFIYDIRK
ncbi:MAG: DUF5698 domain-containing protein [Actinobacteria bacterium]|nr:DUF5698 domain-containing protein [Actinomycetota bacterium]